MKAIEPLYRKVLLHLNWMEEPVELWWTDKFVKSWDRREIRRLEFIRVQASPYSILEFDPDLIKKLEITDEVRHRDSPYITKSTLFLKYLKREEMPIPKNPILGFDYPVSFMGFYDAVKREIKYLDCSNYLTLEFLQEDGVMAEDVLMDPDHWDTENFFIEYLMFVEYSML